MTKKTALLTFGILIIAIIAFLLVNNPSATLKTNSQIETSDSSAVAMITPSLSFSPKAIKLDQNSESTVSVILDQNNLAVVGATLVIKYDPTKVSITQLTGKPLLPVVLSQAKISAGTAEISISTPPDSKGNNQSGDIATFQVRGLSRASSVITFGDETAIVSLDQDGNILKSKGELKVN